MWRVRGCVFPYPTAPIVNCVLNRKKGVDKLCGLWYYVHVDRARPFGRRKNRHGDEVQQNHRREP